ncbi:hypothetical protein Maes01_01408 [Microbulbifer aestuariivivens]|uniref:PepSY domain-containing protein n=1 Tax=Microbulbifer aestuariivivens TaxID=1908308 RepID=A0ABP9WP04_9GAMM
MKLANTLRKVHKWLFLLIGIQALLWTASGFYMVVINLDFIHGDHLVRNLNEPLPAFSRPLYPTAQLIGGREAVKSVKLKILMGHPYYLLQDANGTHRYDAYNGGKIPPLNAAAAAQLARHFYAADGAVSRTRLITAEPPIEIPARVLPVWRIDFDDRFGTSLYIDPDTGALITRRHDYWRAFDFLWMLHIMDYDERADIHNTLLLGAGLLSLASVLAGLMLLFHSFGKRGVSPQKYPANRVAGEKRGVRERRGPPEEKKDQREASA